MPEEPPRRAVALRYDSGAPAPRVAATGRGLLADRIIAAARDAGVPVREDPALTEALSALEIEADVPPEMWTAVAETLAWAYRLEREAARRV